MSLPNAASSCRWKLLGHAHFHSFFFDSEQKKSNYFKKVPSASHLRPQRSTTDLTNKRKRDIKKVKREIEREGECKSAYVKERKKERKREGGKKRERAFSPFKIVEVAMDS